MADLQDTYRRYLACCNERRLGQLDQFVHDPIRFNGEMTRLVGYAKAISANIDAVPDLHWEIQDLVADEDTVAVRLWDTGTPRGEWLGIAPSGRSVAAAEFAFYRFREGKIAEMWFVLDLGSIRKQLT